MPRPRRHGLGVPGPGPQRLGPLGRLKGLLDSGDESAMAAAIAERRFLAEVEHPNIVKIYNFVEHDGAGYIVMEYVGGESLRELRNRHREETGAPLPVAQAIAYVLEILPAFGYLHRRGLLYCDFKPDNVIQTEEQLKLIDLGGVRGIGRRRQRPVRDGRLPGARGARGRGVRRLGPLHRGPHAGRAGLRLRPASRTRSATPPASRPPGEVPVFQRYEAFHRFLLKATAADPTARFQSAGEMAEQLLGVLRQVVAIDGGRPEPAPERLFSAELGAGRRASAVAVPAGARGRPLRPGRRRPGHGRALGPDQRQARPGVDAALARGGLPPGPVRHRRRGVRARPSESSTRRRRGRAAGGRHGGGACSSLADGRPADALTFFAAVAAELPGELAPRAGPGAGLRAGSGVDAGPANGDGTDVDRGCTWQRPLVTTTLVAATDPGLRQRQLRAVPGSGWRSGTATERSPRSSASRARRARLRRPPRSPCAACSCAGSRRMPTGAERSRRDVADVLEQLDARDLGPAAPGAGPARRRPSPCCSTAARPPTTQSIWPAPHSTEPDQRAALERTYRSLAKLADSTRSASNWWTWPTPTDPGR